MPGKQTYLAGGDTVVRAVDPAFLFAHTATGGMMRKALSVFFYFMALVSFELAGSAMIYLFSFSMSPFTDPIIAMVFAAILAGYTNYRVAKHLAGN